MMARTCGRIDGEVISTGSSPICAAFSKPFWMPTTRRYLGRHNIVQLVARSQDRPVGFLLGFEMKPRVFFLWFLGVLSSHRRQGVASQLLDALHEWCQQNEYETIRCECFNGQRPMLHRGLESEYDIIGLRWDADHGDNLILLQKTLA